MAVSLTQRSCPGRGCRCCAIDTKDRMRRTVRRVERQSWRGEVRRGEY